MLTKERVVQDKSIDNTLDLLKEGYLFIQNRSQKYHTDIFETHLMGEKVICMTGEDAAKLFYNPEYFERKGAVPKRAQKTIFGENAIQTMDGKEHDSRKQIFLSITTPENQKKLSYIFTEKLKTAAGNWDGKKDIVLYDEAKKILCETACQFAGVPLNKSEVKERAEDLSTMVNSFASVGIEYFKGKTARSRTERWIKTIIEDVRSGKLKAEGNSPLHIIAFHTESDRTVMDSEMAAIELINIIRPIVAIAAYISFIALALYKHPECKMKLASRDEGYSQKFVDEIRRYYPFSPFIGARAKKDFLYHEYKFNTRMLVLLDLYGTDHDMRIWQNPYEFNPDRFTDRHGSLFDFMPQGGGDVNTTHRCPGEGFTVEIMKVSTDFLVNRIDYTVPEQNMGYNLHRIPTFVESGFIINNVKNKTR